MQVALINLRDGISKNEFPQLGLLYLASVLRKAGHTVDFFDATAENETIEGIASALKAFKPDACCFSLYTSGLLKQYDFIKKIKDYLSNCLIIVGGPHASALPHRTMEECKDIDYLVYGEGEVTVEELLKAIDLHGDISKINGILYKRNGNITTTAPRELIEDLDTIPFPAYDIIIKKKYRYHSRKMEIGNKIAVIISSRGCPWNCTFCYKKTFGTSYRRRSVRNVIDEIKLLTSEYGFNDITFVDDLFTANRKWLTEFCKELRENNIKVPWKCLARVDTVNKADMEMMKESGCYGIEFGVESGNEDVLKDINKKTTIPQIKRAFKDARETGLMTSGFFIFGNRLDTRETILQTMALAKDIKPDFCGFAVLLPFPGTEVYNLLDSSLRYDWKIFNSYYGYKHPISLCAVHAEDLQKYGRQASPEYYGSAKYMISNILFSKNPLRINWYKFLFFGYFFIKKMYLWIKNDRIFLKTYKRDEPLMLDLE